MVEIALMVVAALIIGYSKTALGGLAVISVAIFATIMPAKESTAASSPCSWSVTWSRAGTIAATRTGA